MEWDEERKGVIRSMKLLADETSALTREVRESAAVQLQVILDHVKDAIITVDTAGKVETLNATGERIFGYEEAEVRGRSVDLLIPNLPRQPGLTAGLEDLATTLENTQKTPAPAQPLPTTSRQPKRTTTGVDSNPPRMPKRTSRRPASNQRMTRLIRLYSAKKRPMNTAISSAEL